MTYDPTAELPGGYRWLRCDEPCPDFALWFDADPSGTLTMLHRTNIEHVFSMSSGDRCKTHNSRMLTGKDWPSDSHGLCGFIVRSDIKFEGVSLVSSEDNPDLPRVGETAEEFSSRVRGSSASADGNGPFRLGPNVTSEYEIPFEKLGPNNWREDRWRFVQATFVAVARSSESVSSEGDFDRVGEKKMISVVAPGASVHTLANYLFEHSTTRTMKWHLVEIVINCNWLSCGVYWESGKTIDEMYRGW